MSTNITGKELKNIENGSEVVLDGKKYNLTFDLNALCELEDRYGSLDGAMKKLSSITGADKKIMKDIRFLLWQALKHENDELTEAQAGKLVTIQNMQTVSDALGCAMQKAAPEPDGKNATGPQER